MDKIVNSNLQTQSAKGSVFMRYIRARLELLQQPGMCCYLLSCLLATTGGGLSYIATTWLVLKFHSGIHYVAIVSLCFWLPGIFLGPIAGVWVDRYDRKVLYIIVNFFRAFIFILFGTILHFSHHVGWCYLLAVLNGATFPFYPPLSSSLIREIASEDRLDNANATIGAIYEVGNVCGMGVLAAILLAFFSAEDALVVTGFFLSLAAIISIWIVRPFLSTELSCSAKGMQAVVKQIKEFKQGLQYIIKRPKICLIYSVQALLMMSGLTLPVLLAPFAKSVLHATGGEFGWVETALSLGIILGSVIMPFLKNKIGFSAVGYLCVAGSSITMAWFALNHQLYTAYFIYALLGFCLSLWALVMSESQKITALDFQGRTQAVFNTISSIGIVAIYFLVNAFSVELPMQDFFYGAAVIMALNILFLWRYSTYKLSE